MTALSDTSAMIRGFGGGTGNHLFQAFINGPLLKPSSYVLVVTYLGDKTKEDLWAFLPDIEQIVVTTFGHPFSGPDSYRVSDISSLFVRNLGSQCIRGPGGSLQISRQFNVITFAYGRNPKVDFGASAPECLSEKKIIVRRVSLSPTKP